MFRLSIARPCSASWADMRPEDGGRFCGSCAKHVHDLSGVTELRARALAAVYGSSGLCARIVAGASGAAIFVPEREPPLVTERAPASSGVLPFGTAAAAMVLAAATGCTTPARPPPGVAAGPPAPAPPALVVTAHPTAATSAAPAAPDPDMDGDTVPDEVDRCPGTPGAPEANGCPKVLVGVTTGDLQILQRPTFAFGGSQPKAENEALLDEIAQVLAEHPEIKRLAVEGHTSPDEPRGARLAESRAKAIVARLVKRGVDASRLIPRGLGDTRPLAPNTTPAGRERNRRVELHIEPDPTTTSL